MKAKGNGDVAVCVENLLRTFRGEVPFERIKGLNPRIFDTPTAMADPEIRQDAEWLIETYEPRATINNIAAALGDENGGIGLTADIAETGG